jgi:uncharacterized protein YmfQ (DUF2313 family)
MNTKADISHLIKKLFPPGKAWLISFGSGLNNLIDGIAEEFYRIHQQIELLIKNCFPSTVEELLPEWESEYGIPNAVYTETSNINLRRAQIKTLYTFDGNVIIPNKAFYIGLAAQLGYVVTNITDGSDGYFECGVSCAGDYLGEGIDDDLCIVYVNGSAVNGARLERAFNWLKQIDIIFQFVYSE